MQRSQIHLRTPCSPSEGCQSPRQRLRTCAAQRHTAVSATIGNPLALPNLFALKINAVPLIYLRVNAWGALRVEMKRKTHRVLAFRSAGPFELCKISACQYVLDRQCCMIATYLGSRYLPTTWSELLSVTMLAPAEHLACLHLFPLDPASRPSSCASGCSVSTTKHANNAACCLTFPRMHR